MHERRKNELLEKRDIIVEKLAQAMKNIDEAQAARERASHHTKLQILAVVILLLAIEFAGFAWFDNVNARIHKQDQKIAQLERELLKAKRINYAPPDLPPPYETVRSRFDGWHICTTDDCGTPRNEPF